MRAAVAFATAQQDARDLVELGSPGVPEARTEARRRQVREGRGGRGEAQQALWGHNDERTQLGMPCLTTQQVEVLFRRGAVGDADIPLGPKREEALQSRARVLGSLALVAVWQQ